MKLDKAKIAARYRCTCGGARWKTVRKHRQLNGKCLEMQRHLPVHMGFHMRGMRALVY